MNSTIFASAASPEFASAQRSVFHAPMSDAWRAARAGRHVAPGMPSSLDATRFDSSTFDSSTFNSIAPKTDVVRGASAELVSTAGRLAYGAAKQAAPPRGRLR